MSSRSRPRGGGGGGGGGNDDYITHLKADLFDARARAERCEHHLTTLTEQHDRTEHEHVACLQQLARAFAHLENVFLAHMEPDEATYDPRRIGEWLVHLKQAVPREAYDYILRQSEELDARGYGKRVSLVQDTLFFVLTNRVQHQKDCVSDVTPGSDFKDFDFDFQHSYSSYSSC